ncbi:O-antigen ligase domain-containing protein [Pseudomonas putida]|uniref:O-antigen ligase domain-containing protein n=1 Tax=Pseudomonas putida TaxID=303 RepID=UPI0020C2CA4A|nr:O-antigen ligase domain-containing protein [Pseudomonas putida]UTL79544.1 O-antigen ligase domain-containing protein [Pseudomonas putida]
MRSGTEVTKTDLTALISMLFLFPGTFFYQSLVGLGYIPAFAGGYFGIASAAVFLVLAARYSYLTLKTGRVQTFDALYFGFLFYFAFIALFNAFVVGKEGYLAWHIGSVIQCAAVYMIFKGIAKGSKGIMTFSWLSITAMTIFIFAMSENGVFSVSAISGNKEAVSSYQGFALNYMLIAIIAIVNTRSRAIRLAAHPVFALALYMNGARSEFVAFLMFAILFEVCKSHFKMLSTIAAASILSIAGAMLYSGVIDIPENRVTTLLNLSENNSAQLRNKLSESGLSKIIENPILGDYGNYDKGYYIHNILSAWLDLGFFGFIYLTSLIFIPMIMIGFRVALKRNSNTQNSFMFASMFSCFILLVAGKYFTYLMVPAVLGYYAAASRHPCRDSMQGEDEAITR